MPLASRGSGYTPGFALGVLYLVVLFVDAFATVIVPRGPAPQERGSRQVARASPLLLTDARPDVRSGSM
jgi:hypothetical protein